MTHTRLRTALLCATAICACASATAEDKKFGQFPKASTLKDSAIALFVQDGATVNAPLSVVTAYIASHLPSLTSQQMVTALGYVPMNKAGDTMLGPLVLPAPSPTANDNNAATTGFAQALVATLKAYIAGLLQANYTLQVPSAAALRNLVGFSGIMVHRGGFATPGDGGAADYAFNAAACPAPIGDDGGSCLAASGGGSWRLDWGSVGQRANGWMFGFVGAGAGTSATDTAALQAAINTGRWVDFPETQNFQPSACLNLSTPGQRIVGHGREASRINVAAGSTFSVFCSAGANRLNFSSASDNAFLAGKFSVDVEDLAIYYTQPTVPPSDPSGLNQYPAAFSFQNTSRFQIRRVGCYAAWICVDAQGYSGDSDVEDFKFSSFSPNGGILIDGALDYVRLHRLYWWPAGFPGANGAYYPLFFSTNASTGPLAIGLGRADGFLLSDSLFIGGRALKTYAGIFPNTAGGDTRGTVTGLGMVSNNDFDSYGAITIDGVDSNGNATNLQFNGNVHTIGGTQHFSFTLVNGTVTMTNEDFGIGAATTNPPVNVTGGTLSMTGSTFNLLGVDVQAIIIGGGNGGYVTLGNNTFLRKPGTTYSRATIQNSGGQLVATGNHQNPVKAGSVFISDQTPNSGDIVVGNSGGGAGYQCNSSAVQTGPQCASALPANFGLNQ